MREVTTKTLFDEEGSDQLGATALILLKNLWPKNAPLLKVRVVLAFVCLVISKVVGVFIPVIFRDIVDCLSQIETSSFHWVLALVFGYGVARICQSLFNELRDVIFVRVAQRAQRAIALATFEHLHKLSLDFHLARQTGGLSRIIDRGVKGISFILSFMMFNILPTLCELVLVAGFLAYLMDYRYTLIVLLCVAVYVAYTLLCTEWRLKYRREMNREDANANTKAIDSLLNFETVKYFGNEEHEYRRFDSSLVRYEDSAVAAQKSLFILNFGQACIIGCGNVAMFLLAVNDVHNHSYTLGDFVMLNTYMMQLFIPLNFLGFVYREMKQGLIDMSKMTELWAISPTVKDDPSAPALRPGNASIEFKNVSFSYQEGRDILKDISFRIEGGKTLALVGASGSGKSTIARLLFRFYDPDSGQILIDGQNLRAVSLTSLHQVIGVVPQDTVLFNDSLSYNIEYGRPGASSQEIEVATKRAKLDRLIEKLPQKLNTLVGERGLKLSGGEKQRVSIARTILKDPPILIFDEATSALDSHTESEIQAELNLLAERKTTLIIAHRLSTVMDADEILVIDEGQIVERGTHQSLLKKGGHYFALWTSQRESEQSS